MSANLLMSRWSADGIDLWAVDLQTVPLVQGTATYSVPSNTVAILDTYITVTNGSVSTNRIILPISRSDYATYPNPQMQGFPTVFWYDQLLSPTITIWPVPNGQQTTLSYYRLRQSQDSVLAGGVTVEMPYYFADAFVYGLSYRLAVIWAADRVAMLKPLADEAYDIASSRNIETAQITIQPNISGYFRP